VVYEQKAADGGDQREAQHEADLAADDRSQEAHGPTATRARRLPVDGVR
jgi:hypothetical protein